jgi:outer membrane protein TolC
LEAEVIGAREAARALLGRDGDVPDGFLLIDATGSPVLDGVAFEVPVIDPLGPPPNNPSLRVADATVEHAALRATLLGIAGRPDFVTAVQTGIRFGGREPFFSASIGIPLALWSGRKQTPLAQAGIMDLTAAEEEHDELSLQVTAAVRTRVADLEASRLRARQITAETAPLATAAAASALQQYRTGAVEFTSVLETQDELFRVQLDLARIVSHFGTRRAELAALTGEEWYR